MARSLEADALGELGVNAGLAHHFEALERQHAHVRVHGDQKSTVAVKGVVVVCREGFCHLFKLRNGGRSLEKQKIQKLTPNSHNNNRGTYRLHRVKESPF